MSAGVVPEAALLGSWSATRWQYASRDHHGLVVDVVAGLRGTVTLSVSAGAFVVSWDAPGHGSGSVGGTVATVDGDLILRLYGADEPAVMRYRVSDLTLALSSDGSAWDFQGHGEEPAEFTAVLVRL
jgi:hypothetical protein